MIIGFEVRYIIIQIPVLSLPSLVIIDKSFLLYNTIIFFYNTIILTLLKIMSTL